MSTITNTGDPIWKKYKRREDFNICPHCGKPLVWIYDGIEYFLCDTKPVLFTMHPEGKQTLIYKRQELDHCIIYDSKNPLCTGIPCKAHIQHFYTCPEMLNRRRDYAKSKSLGGIINDKSCCPDGQNSQ